MGINIGPWVLHLAELQQNWGYNLVDLGNQLEHGIIGQMLESKFALHRVTGISLAEDSVAITRHNL